MLTKEIFASRADDAGSGILDEAVLIAANDNYGRACGFVHEEPRSGGEFIGNGEDCGAEKFAMAVARAAEIDERWDTGRADGHVDQTQAPGAAKRVADDDGEALTGFLAQSVGKPAGGTVGIFWKERDEIAAADIRMVHACIGANETVMRFDDEDAIGAHDAPRFAKDYLDETWIVHEFFGQG